ncbi:hypothetical protein [Paenibacillus sp. Marseille-Q4541]|uniref:hypothetical protein n=1 Tax=Paenibacillus sp. Marseille-Q4541 TaxID=2831522 RepID=UPI001BA6D880|nr:hypothetical protein [Paenibacillus sp. Marseille-Q4541]
MPVNLNEVQPREMSDKEWLNTVANALENAHVFEQQAEGEGSKVIWISKELVEIMVKRMRKIAEKLE